MMKKSERIKRIGAPLNFVFITDQHNRLNEYTNEYTGVKPNNHTRELAVNAIRSIQYIP